ncbi:hypothetical protein D1122_21280 [Cereibacter sphaeroides]|uniref:hypothetical protein n=1 Tax=Cereibacter sphaeroides TaxID=1063 RepID=UPI000E5B5B48|nr:hypothetical protein [Cereibacter sphaeroides]MWP39870.1 hypothetical protein [Cereibacter sphaeroides]RHZ91466.1 hypothetical protein D1122_21280 [Cereibacter sphaeroides]
MMYAAPFDRSEMVSSLEPLARVQDGATMSGKSPGKSSAKREAMTYRAFFAARWSRFVRENFDSPEHAAMTFGVDGSTARKWWDGSHSPSGFVVGLAYQNFPAEAATTLQAQE